MKQAAGVLGPIAAPADRWDADAAAGLTPGAVG